METKIVVICKGGLVTNVSSNNPNVKIVIVDHDSEDWTENGEPGATVEGSSCVSDVLAPDYVNENLSELFSDNDSQSKYVKAKLKNLNF